MHTYTQITHAHTHAHTHTAHTHTYKHTHTPSLYFTPYYVACYVIHTYTAFKSTRLNGI